MAIPEYNYIPTYIKRTIANKPKDVITHSYWNELFNLLITQGDHTAEELGKILNHFTTVITGAASDTAAAIAEEHEYASAFEIHLSTNANPITADKTFAEIRQAIVDKREILLWVSEVQCLKPTCKAFEHTITLTVFDYSFAGPVVRADVYECYDENEWFVKQNIELAKQNNVGDTRNLTTTHKYNLVAAINEVKQTADTKQDKLVAGKNITIADDGKTISANTVGVLEITLTTQNGVSVADKTFEQVKAAADSGIPVLKVHSDGAISWFFLLDKSPTEIDFIGFVDEQIIAYLTAKQDGTWETTVAARVTAEMLSAFSEKIGSLGQLTTTDKTNIVAAINEVKQAADGKQDKLIAGDNITIAADGKTISATGGGGSYDDTELRQRIGDIEAKESTWDAKSNFSGSYNDLTDKPTIPTPITEQTVSSWGFTKNTGTYSKPTGGIPKADLAKDVQASLSKAETALQSVSTDDINALAVTNAKISNGAVSTGKIANKAVTEDKLSTEFVAKVDGKQPMIDASHKLPYAYLSDTPTIPTVPTNVSAFTNDAGYLTLATLPKYEGVVE